MTSPTEEFVYALAKRFTDLAPILKDHAEFYGEVLPHIFFYDLTQWLLSLLESGAGTDARERRQRLQDVLDTLEKTFANGNDQVKELISVSFLENLPNAGEDGSEIRLMLGPALTEELRKIEEFEPRAGDSI